MSEHPHIFLGNKYAEEIDFSPLCGGSSKEIPSRDIHEQANKLRAAYNQAIETANTRLAQRQRQQQPSANGVYLDISIDKDVPIPFSQLDTSKTGAKLMCVKEANDDVEGEVEAEATIYVPTNHENWLDSRLNDYETKKTSKDKPVNHPLIDAIEDISLSSVISLFPRKEEYDSLLANHNYTFELWIDETDEEAMSSVFEKLEIMGITYHSGNILHFEQVTILLVDATKEAIDDIPFALDKVEAVKRYYNPMDMLDDNQESRDWSKLIEDDVIVELNSNSPRVSIIDGGVNNAHRLLLHSLPDERCASVVDDRPHVYRDGHGTGMAGLALYGDLTEEMWQRGHLVVNHDLASVKILSDVDNNPKLYGLLTYEAIYKSEDLGAKISCMAITEDREENDGTPTSWSAAIDNALYHDGACDRMMILSAGNTREMEMTPDDYLIHLNGSSIQTPCEALNAIVVGAYTEKVICRDGYTPLAASGGISPYSRTSMLWRGKNAKPDIVMEGGNMGFKPLEGASPMAELSLVTTSEDVTYRPLQDFNATSAASALAAQLAAKIKYVNPELSILSVRALMIHSSSWTDKMLETGTKMQDIMAYCGYGVPNESLALASKDTETTFIFENELVPFQEGKNGNVFNQMHFYDLPWPKDVLLGMGAEPVEMRVTLSYYIEPSPTHKGNYSKYRYQSAGLAFDVKTANETQDQFIARHNSKRPIDDKSDNDTKRWTIGQKLREAGTVQSDWFSCTAAELATCNQIGIFPTNGWWKERKLGNVGNKIKYSLVVSVKTAETPIYDAIKTVISPQVEIATNR